MTSRFGRPLNDQTAEILEQYNVLDSMITELAEMMDDFDREQEFYDLCDAIKQQKERIIALESALEGGGAHDR